MSSEYGGAKVWIGPIVILDKSVGYSKTEIKEILSIINERKKLNMNGTSTLKNENDFYISKFGMWIYIDDKEYFINFADYPSLAKHIVEELAKYSFDMENNIHWEELDIDIEKEALDESNKYTLLYR